MPDVWLDTVTPKISIAIHSMLPVLHEKNYGTIVTAKQATQTTDLLDVLKVPYHKVGHYGETLEGKLVAEQKRTLEFLDLFNKVGKPKVLWTHGDVSAIRTAFGLGIPIVYANDTTYAYHVAKLVCPLADWLIAPVSFGKSWSRFGISKKKIVLYDGVEELAWLKGTKYKEPTFLSELKNKKPIILFRDAEYKASYINNVKIDTQKLLEELTKLGTVAYLPRYEEEKKRLKNLKNVWTPPEPVLTAQLLPYIDLMVGSGGTACKETALMGIPTINFHFWEATARYIYKKGFPIQLEKTTNSIIKASKKILENPKKYRMNTKVIIDKLESPIPVWVRYIEKLLYAN